MSGKNEQRFGLLDRGAAFSWRFLLCAATVVVLGWVLLRLRVLVLPLVLAVILASVLSPLANWLQRHHVPRLLAILLAMFLPIAAVGVAIALILPAAASQLGNISGAIQQAAESVVHWLERILRLSPESAANLQQQVNDFGHRLGTILVQGIASGIPVVADILAETVLTFAFIFYFLLDGTTIWHWIVRLFPLGRRELVGHLGGSAWVTLRGYLRGMLIVATFDASLIGLGFFALRVPLAGAIAVLIFLGAFIPVVGAAAAGGVGVLVALANGGWPQALAALAIVVVVQEIETNLVSPYAVGRSVKLHPLVALAAAIAGAIVAGIPGAILAVPAVAVALRMVVGVQQFSPSQTEDGPQTAKAENEPIET